jgi:hypothetical protein
MARHATEPASSSHGAIRAGRCQHTPKVIAAVLAVPNRIHSMALNTPY